ncbi:MAG: tRNA pseudouridine(13) synthase TruD [Phycisphaerales bacterium]
MITSISPLPGHFVTRDLPGVGGRLRARDEDFLVDEMPLYQPSGEGDFIYLFIEKQRLSTMDAVRVLADHFEVPESAVSFAGMKDKYAITRQHFSIEAKGRDIASIPSIRDERLRVLWADRHTNRLKLGHLKGNRFSIRIRDVAPTDVIRANRVIQQLRVRGVPNYFGEQRFGSRLNNHILAIHDIKNEPRALLDALLLPNPETPDRSDPARDRYAQADYEGALRNLSPTAVAEREALRALARGASAQQAVRSISKMQRRFWFTALQSAIFNRVLDRRIESNTLTSLQEGDLAMKHDNGACFKVDAATATDPDTLARLESLAISPSGPMWGRKMTRPRARALEDETAPLADFAITTEEICEGARHLGKLALGKRRALRVPLTDPEIEGGADEFGPFIRCAFDLPAGSFATVVMREIMKNTAPLDHDEPDTEHPDEE